MNHNFNKNIIQIPNILLSLFIGFLIGYLIMSTYGNNISDERSNYLENKRIVDELNLLVSQNHELTTKRAELSEEIDKLKTSYTANKLVKDNIKKYNLLLGNEDIKGPGVLIKINIDLAPFWFIDIVNELYDLGAEAISLNDIFINASTSFMEDIDNHQIMVNNKTIASPFKIQVIGNPNILFKGITNDTGLLARLKNSFPDRENDIQIMISNELIIKEQQNNIKAR